MAPSATLLAQFEAFWAAYPDRPDNPKAAARAVFERRVREGASAADLVGAARRYAEHVRLRKLDANFIPHARTWLSQRRYEDYQIDAPAEGSPAPETGHPLGWLTHHMEYPAWLSWIAPLRVAVHPMNIEITARTQLAADHVLARWGDVIMDHYGCGIAFTVSGKEHP